MAIEVLEYYAGGPHARRVEDRFNPSNFGSDKVVVAEVGKPGKSPRKRRKPSAAVIALDGESALVLSKGAIYDVRLLVGDRVERVTVNAVQKQAVLQMRSTTMVESVLADAEPIDIELVTADTDGPIPYGSPAAAIAADSGADDADGAQAPDGGSDAQTAADSSDDEPSRRSLRDRLLGRSGDDAAGDDEDAVGAGDDSAGEEE